MDLGVENTNKSMKIGAFVVDAARNRLVHNGKAYSLEPQIMDVLCVLTEKPGEVFTRDDLIDLIWKVEHGGDESLSRAISILRKTFKKAGEDDLYIETIYKRGYRLKAPVSQTISKIGKTANDIKTEKEISIAVLAFEDMSRSKDFQYFSDGISEEIINALVKIPYLRVTGRTSSFSFKGKDASIRDIASTLSVSHILEGSVRKNGDRLRITAQLIDATKDKHIWSETFDGALGDIFSLQEKIARATEQQLNLAFSAHDAALHVASPGRLAGSLTTSTEAYAFFVQGRSLMHQQDGQDTLPRAIEFLEKAVAFDPKFVEAWVCLAVANFYLLEHARTPNWRGKISAGWRAAQRASDLNPDIALTRSTLGYQALFDLKIDELVDICEEVHELEPASPVYEYTYGNALASIGQSERGLKMMESAISREPLSASWINGIGHPKFALGDFDGANVKYQQSLDMGYDGAMFTKAILLKHTKDSKIAIDFLRENSINMGSFPRSMMPSRVIWNLNISASFGKSRLSRWLVYIALRNLVKSKKTQPTVGLSFRCYTLGYPKLFMEAVRNHPTPYLGAALAQLWTPTIEAKRIRTHKDFPKFADDIGLVSAWQAYGWPKTIKPIHGTDGSDGQFTCT